MELAGLVQDVSLPEIFRLLKMGAKTGALRVTNGRQWGDVYFRNGEVYYAASSNSGAPLGQRLVRAGVLASRDLARVLAEQKAAEKPKLLGALLKEHGLVTQDTLNRYIGEQIRDSVFNLFSWPRAEFNFVLDQEPSVGDVVVSLDVEYVIMEGSRRVDEWPIIMERLGSLEKVPYLAGPTSSRQISLRSQDWDVLCFIDGRRDINTIVEESGFDRFNTAKVIHGLASAGLVVTKDPTLELLGQRRALALRGPIDIYNLSFLTSLCTSDISNHLRVENLDHEEVEVHISAGILEETAGGTLVYFCENRTPISVIRRMALETSGFILLVNINSRHSVQASRRDVALMEEIGDKPWTVATYASLVDEKVTEDEVRELLALPDQVPVLNCDLRNPEETGAVAEALLALIP